MDDPSRAATKALGLQALGHKHDTRCEQTTCGADTFEKAWTIQATAMADGGGGTADVVEDLYLKYFSDQITAIYRVHNPSKLDSIPALLTKHSARLPHSHRVTVGLLVKGQSAAKKGEAVRAQTP